MGPIVSTLARRYATARADEEAAWNGACATARIEFERTGRITVSAASTEAGRESAQLRAEADRAWAALVASCPGGDEEANVRAAAYLPRWLGGRAAA